MFLMVFGIVQCVFLTIDVFGASRQAVFFHVTVACSFLSTSLAAVVGMYVAHACFCSRGVGWGRVTNNVPDDFKTVGHKGPCNFLFLFLFLLLLLLLLLLLSLSLLLLLLLLCCCFCFCNTSYCLCGIYKSSHRWCLRIF